MKKTLVKICGLTNFEDAALAARLGADLLGFIMIPGAARNVAPREFLSFRDKLPKSAKLVCVTRDRPIEELLELAGCFDVLQLHGSESPAFAGEAALLSGREVWKALPLCDEALLAAARTYPPEITLLAEGERSGLKRKCDWKLAALLGRERRIILAGGLGPENLAAAAAAVKPAGVDVSSGVAREDDPRKKDHVKLAAFMEAARSIK